jgi:arylsulfatase A-like enzyme
MDEWTAPNQRGVPGYEGFLNNQVTTLPQLLKDAGYHTYMVGKWHLGKSPDLIPAARGFERDFSLLDGAGSYWDMTGFTALVPNQIYTEDGRYLSKLPDDYYATKTYTDKLIGYIDANRATASPSSPTYRTRRRTTPTTCPRTGATATSAPTTRAGTRCARSA